MARNIDTMAEFEAFKENILPALRQDIKSGKSAEQIYAKYAAIAAARGVSIAMTEVDSGKALSALRDILDRTQGKAVERIAVKHRFENLKEEELDALLISRAREIEDVEDQD